MLSGCNGDSPWAGTAAESAHYLVEAALGGYSSTLVSAWSPPDGFDQSAVSCLVPDRPNVWTDGSLVLDKVAGISSSGAGFFAHQSDSCWSARTWGQVDRLHSVGDSPSCRGFCSVPGPLQSVQRAEMWGVILALQSSGALHLGVDNLGVVRHVGRLLDGRPGSVPFELLNDGDLLLLIDRMIRRRGADTVSISKVKGHADEVMVRSGQVRDADRLGNDAADDAADFGRRRVGNSVIDARRNLCGVCNRWYPVILDLHRFFIAVSRAVVNYDGGPGTAPDPLVWSAGSLPKRRRLVHAVRDRAFLPGPPGLWDSEWVAFPAPVITDDDIALWPILLDFWLSGFLFWLVFIGLLVGLILVLAVFLMLSFSSCMNFGLVRGSLLRRLLLVILGPGAQFQCRLFLLVQALIFGALVVFWQLSCGLFVCFLVVWAGLFLAPLVLIIAVYGILAGQRVVMGSLLDLVKVLPYTFWMSS